MILYYILVLSLPLKNHWLFGSDVGGQGGFTLVKYLGIACLPIALIRLVFRPKSTGFRISGVSIAFFIYFVIALFSHFAHGGTFQMSSLELPNLLSMMLFFVLTICLVDSLPRLHRVILILIGSVGVASIYTVRDWMANRYIPGYRPGGISGDANYFAVCASTCLVIGLHLVLSHRPRWEKLYLYGCLGCISIALIMAASRGGFVGLVVGLLLLMVGSGRGLRSLLVVTILVVPLLFVVPNTTVQRILNPSSGDQGAVQEREITWRAGLNMVSAHPLGGVGLGQFKNVVLQYENDSDEKVWSLAHNTYIEVAAELGIFGFLAYIILLLSAFFALHRVVRNKGQHETPLFREIAIGLEAGLLTTAVGSFFVSAWWLRFLWIMLFLPACLPTVERSIGMALRPAVPALDTGLPVTRSLR